VKALNTGAARWRLAVAGVLAASVVLGVSLWIAYNETVRTNYSSPAYYYLQIILYVLCAVFAGTGFWTGYRSLRNPGTGSGLLGTALLLMLVAVVLWACVSTLLARAYFV
jgi:hypothetical protein